MAVGVKRYTADNKCRWSVMPPSSATQDEKGEAKGYTGAGPRRGRGRTARVPPAEAAVATQLVITPLGRGERSPAADPRGLDHRKQGTSDAVNAAR